MRHIVILLVIISTGQANHRVRRVVDGRTASPGQFSYLASIQTYSPIFDEKFHSCGGSILNERYILTAAHCINEKLKSRLSVLVGTNSLSKGGERYYIENMKVHHKYKNRGFLFSTLSSNDIGIIKVNRNITFNKLTQPIPIASHQEQIPVGSKLTISGWGSTNKFLDIYTENIQYFEGTLISNKKCKTLYTNQRKKKQMQLTTNDICTMAPVNRGVCDGDSGSPVVYNGTLVGIVSRTGEVCAIGVPDIHTKASRYEKWIEKTIAQMNKNPTGIVKKRKPNSNSLPYRNYFSI